ncbi:MAG: CinA family protein [Alphaproteobacteria bacterium]|nr:CinA family protein [Alphaproteobacteria bacterium]MBU0802711.1 CinA family protein [Alphaproteobacteria bacterium]MBU0871508.1 CinA family protein [Alphaproteobacteria bacterium]MBU1400175.1 CinA family protein [Alphaproteobacteria bacterium]MBU1591295.1 CinA family protein [Alphaproteobacteria bacterium]
MTGMAELSDRFLQACARRKILVATAESCTGGMIISWLTDIPGSSSMVDRGFVTYSNEAKMEMLGVSADTLEAHGAVSQETAAEMANGALEHSRAGITLAVTGIAGPDGGSEEKPIGLVWFGLAMTGKPTVTEKRVFQNLGRDYIRRETAKHALEMGLRELE